MTDYYEILGLPQTASSIDIRASYKRLAMEFHPDRNPGNPEAEEKFKIINEAYHVLSDPLKKSRYDARMNSQSSYGPNYDEVYWQEVRRARYYQWKHSQENRYVFDKQYFKIQGLAFLVFLIISGFCFGVVHSAYYIYDLRQQEIHEQNLLRVAEVNNLFLSGKIDEAFTLIHDLHEQNPLEYEFINARDSLVDVLRKRAFYNYSAQQFLKASTDLKHLKKYEFPPRVETLEKLSTALFRSANYEEANQYLKQLYTIKPWDVEVVYQIGTISTQYLHDNKEALMYFTIGKRLFKENLSHAYGEAFEVVMNPQTTPEIYYQIFLARARVNIELENYSEAEKDTNWGIFLRPAESETYKLRAMAKAQTKSRGLCADLSKAKQLGADVLSLQRKYCR